MSKDTDSLVVSYAQNREDVILNAFLWDVENGFYVDVGAYDPVEDSVTRYFYERGWSGINIEPNKIFFEKLKKQRPRDINLNVGVSNKEEKLIYREYIDGKGLSTFSDSMKKGYESSKTDRPISNYKDREIRVLTLKQIFKQNDVKEIHFLKVDVEGYEFEVLESNDWKKYRPEVICIEANHILRDWHELLKESKYQSVFNDGLNEYFVDSNKMDRWRNFRYVETIIGREIVTPKQYEINNALASSRVTIETLIQKNSKLKERIAILEFALADSKRLKNQIKGLAQAVDNVISVRIDNLNKQKYSHTHFSYDKDSDATQLIKLAHQVDQATYSKKKSGPKKTLHKTLHATYGTSRKVTKKAAKGAFRLLKSGKRLLKGAK
jgi:FkbM family methyltransferase